MTHRTYVQLKMCVQLPVHAFEVTFFLFKNECTYAFILGSFLVTFTFYLYLLFALILEI